MAVGLKSLPLLHSIDGLRLGTTAAGLKKRDHRDLVIMEIAVGSNVAAVFTRNAFQAAPVTIAKKHLASASPRYLLINSGNANAGTGETGLDDAQATCESLAKLADCRATEVLPFSTGVIGERLPMGKLNAALPVAYSELSELGWADAATAIMTTDTVTKGASEVAEVDAGRLTITGIAKGAGMIRPNMATMLCFIATDAKVPRLLLQATLNHAVRRSFNRITVDGDTSTNDACVLIATGCGPVDIPNEHAEGYPALLRAVVGMTERLATAIIRDAEGATKFITVEVTQAANEAEAEQVAFTVAESPLVKTAFFGSDPNWGRFLAAIGRAKVDGLEVGRVNILLDDRHIVEGGTAAADYTEEIGQAIMAKAEIRLRIELGRGDHEARVWTSDLSHDYIRINADYRS